MYGHIRASEIPQLFSQQLIFMGIQTFLTTVRPPLRIPFSNLHWKQSTEDCIPGIGRRRRKNAEIVGDLYVEVFRDQRLQQLPLIESETVEHDEQHSPLRPQYGNEKLLANVHGERRPVGLGIR